MMAVDSAHDPVVTSVPGPVEMGAPPAHPSRTLPPNLLHSEFSSAEDCVECQKNGVEKLPTYLPEGM